MILAYMTLKKHALTHSKKMLKVKIMLEYSIWNFLNTKLSSKKISEILVLLNFHKDDFNHFLTKRAGSGWKNRQV